jgi:hypothetical protein
MDEKNKQWQKPVLIVIGRGKPEEVLLLGCKYKGPGVKGSGTNQNCDAPATCDIIGSS